MFQSENELALYLPLKCTLCTKFHGANLSDMRSHVEKVHQLLVVTEEMTLTDSSFKHLKPGTLSTHWGQPVAFGLDFHVEKSQNSSRKSLRRRSLFKMSGEEFSQEILRRHEEFLKRPAKEYNFMTSEVAQHTLMPSFPQASPSVRNTKANKLYNMPKVSPKYTPVTEFPGLGQLNSQPGLWVPRIGSEVEVGQGHSHMSGSHGEIVIENVEGEVQAGSTVLKLLERKSADEEQMMMITTNGVQSIVRSQDFYLTLMESGHESSQTLQVISSLLEAGEEIEIREEGEQVEIQNI